MPNTVETVAFSHNFGGRASATHFASVVIVQNGSSRVLATVAEPSEFRIRENGTVTVYSRKHKSTSVYGRSTRGVSFLGITRDGTEIRHLNF